jgi:hypothetical protein
MDFDIIAIIQEVVTGYGGALAVARLLGIGLNRKEVVGIM